jgi:hypothetical protein
MKISSVVLKWERVVSYTHNAVRWAESGEVDETLGKRRGKSPIKVDFYLLQRRESRDISTRRMKGNLTPRMKPRPDTLLVLFYFLGQKEYLHQRGVKLLKAI